MNSGSKSVEELKGLLEQTKSEVRKIKAVEAQMRWQMAREEKKETVLAEEATNTEIRDWRWQQSDEMKAFIAEKTAAIRAVELQESKEHQEFKRDFRQQQKVEDLQYVQEVLATDMQHATWRAELARRINDREKELVAIRLEGLQELKEVKSAQRLREAEEQQEERVLEQTLVMNGLARQLAQEKEELLRTIDYHRRCQNQKVSALPRSSLSPSAGRGRQPSPGTPAGQGSPTRPRPARALAPEA